MESNLPIKANEISIFRKIVLFFKNIFHKEEKASNECKIEQIYQQDKKIKKKYKAEINSISQTPKVKTKAKQPSAIEKVIKEIEKDPEKLKKLDVYRLEIIDNYYVQQISEYRSKINDILEANNG